MASRFFSAFFVASSLNFAFSQSSCGPSSGACTPYVTDIYGPLFNQIFADPSVLKVDNSTYYAYATQHKKEDINVPYAVSLNGLRGNWTEAKGKDAMPRNTTGLGAWTVAPHGDSGLWDPDVSQLNSTHFIIYYAAQSAKTNERCIGVGYATSPTGPFIPTPEPLFCPSTGAGAIDVDGVLDTSKSPPDRYVLYKNGSYPGSHSQLSHCALWQVDLADGYTKIGQPIQLTTPLPGTDGEEGAALTQMPNGRWLLMHTEGNWKQNYTTVYALSNGTDIKGPYLDYHLSGILLDSGNLTDGKNSTEIYQPGGPDFVGKSNTDFIFMAKTTNESLSRFLYAGTMAYQASSWSPAGRNGTGNGTGSGTGLGPTIVPGLNSVSVPLLPGTVSVPGPG
ncbi:hypothetical protein MMC28_007967, partial [Mycoblastus sanguinarius]|nr:hypothetical protein [Mycoblastus sanguinarius]